MARLWSRFADQQRDRAAAAGLPSLALESPAHFADLLMHGYFDHHADPSRFAVDNLSETQYQELVVLAESYFASGESWFAPMALKDPDRQRLQARFER